MGSLRDMKNHIENQHGGNKKLYHIKINRDGTLMVDGRKCK